MTFSVLLVLLFFGYIASTEEVQTQHTLATAPASYSPPIPAQFITPIEDNVQKLAENAIKEFTMENQQKITAQVDALGIPSEMDRETNKLLSSLPSMRLSQRLFRGGNKATVGSTPDFPDNVDRLARRVMKELQPMSASMIENMNPTSGPIPEDAIDQLAKKVIKDLPSTKADTPAVIPIQSDAVDRLATQVIQSIPKDAKADSAAAAVPIQSDAVDRLAAQVIQSIPKDNPGGGGSSEQVIPIQADAVDKLATQVIKGLQPDQGAEQNAQPIPHDPVDLLALKIISENNQQVAGAEKEPPALEKDAVDNLAEKVIQGVPH
jgi:hypothetical protein